MATKRISRSATVEGNLVTVSEPKFISLVKKPANQRAFGIVRGQNEDNEVSKPTSRKRIGRTARSESNQNLLSLSLPATLDEAGVKEALATYGLSTFTVSRAEEGAPWVAQNPGAIDCTDSVPIKLAGGLVAQVKRTEATVATEGKNALVVTSLEFNTSQFADQAAVSEWCQRNSVDFDEKALDNPSGNLVLQRAEVNEGEETRLMELEPGVTATIVRDMCCDIPDGFVAVINEYAYCSWGWGQLDFTAAMADEEVTDQLYDSLWVMEDLLRNILFYSPLTVDVKKELISRACAQYATYVSGLLDTLPRQLLVSISAQRSSKENEMSDASKPAAVETKPAARTEETTAPAVGSPEFATAVAAAVTEALAKRDEQAKQAEEERIKREAEAKEQEGKEKEAVEARRAEITEAVTVATKPLVDKIAALEGVTVLRTESTDPKVSTPAKRNTGDLFKGVFGDITRSAPREKAAAATDDTQATE